MKYPIYILALFLVLLSCTSCKEPQARNPISKSSGTAFMNESVERNKLLIKNEERKIDSIIKSNPKIKYFASQKGYWYHYEIKNETDSLHPKKGDVAFFDYEIKDLNGSVIYTQADLKPQTYLVDRQNIMMGLRHGIKLMKKTEKVTFLFPSHMAFGYHGDNDRIGTNEPLMCTVTLTNFEPEKNNTMKFKIIVVAVLLTTLFTACKKAHNDLPDGLYAEIETSKGTIVAELFYKKTPMTVANFVSLAEGKNTFVSENFKGKKFFEGLKFHRVISKANGDAEDFMIQTGDPMGNGSGDAGYKFSDEITNLIHDKEGVLSMANSGPGTNSSQFFITIVPTPWLNGKHTVFGQVTGNGMEVVNKIVVDDYIKSVTIIRKGKDAEQFDAVKIFDEQFKLEAEKLKKQADLAAEIKKPYLEMINNAKATGTKTASGLIYKITQKGSGKKPAVGTTANINYAGYFEDGTLFDSNIKSIEEVFGKYNPQKDQHNGYAPIPFQMGTKEGMIPGFIEGIELLSIGEKGVFVIPPDLGYGPNGYQGVIPPNATLIFELEIVK